LAHGFSDFIFQLCQVQALPQALFWIKACSPYIIVAWILGCFLLF
jgi:hypothetical protein